jgi:hypothetical protein
MGLVRFEPINSGQHQAGGLRHVSEFFVDRSLLVVFYY